MPAVRYVFGHFRAQQLNNGINHNFFSRLKKTKKTNKKNNLLCLKITESRQVATLKFNENIRLTRFN